MPKPFVLANEVDAGFKDASAYDRHRPTYPTEAVQKLLKNLNVADQFNAHIVEVGAGTGKFTELLTKRKEEYDIIAIEPHTEMRDGLVTKKLGDHVVVKGGDASQMEIQDSWGDACIAAQAFHWFATEDSLREIHRVLRPGAVFGVIWNIEDYNAPQEWEPSTKWEGRLKDIISRFEDGRPRFRHQKWKEVFENQLNTTPLQTLYDTVRHRLPLFSLPLGEDYVPWSVWLTEDALWDRFATLSQVAILKGEQMEAVKANAYEAMRGNDVERNQNGEIALHGRTTLAWASRV